MQVHVEVAMPLTDYNVGLLYSTAGGPGRLLINTD